MSIFDPRTETASRETLRQTQLERLQATISRAYRNVRYYRQLFDGVGLAPEDLRTLDDLTRLPLTGRQDLLQHQPYGMFAMPLRDVIRLHPSAGAGGPVVVGYTQNDISTWTRMAARALGSAGVGKDDVLQISLDYAQDAAAVGAQSGAEAIGASVIPTSGLAPQRQADLMRQFRATVLVATPSQALQIGYVLRDAPPADNTLRTAFIVGEVWSDTLRAEIETLLRVEAYGSYGMSEMALPGLATECEIHCGLHIAEDNVLAETVDPQTGAPLPYGQLGELVLTTLTREAVPMIRYRTGDLTRIDDAACACGRTLARMTPTHARADDVVIVHAVRVAPQQIADLVGEHLAGAPCRLVIAQEEGRDTLTVEVGISSEQFSDEMRFMAALRDRIESAIKSRLTLEAVVRFTEPSWFRDRSIVEDRRNAEAT